MKIAALLVSGASTALAVSRTSPPDGCLHVATSGGDYTTVQAAIDALDTSSSDDQCVFVDEGTYTEQVYIADRAAQLTIYGYTTDSTSYNDNGATLTYNLPASTAGSNDASGTLRVWAENVKVYNLNVVNSCFQDTLLANEGSQWYEGCEITGATDFIFGQEAAAWFEGCDIRVREGGYYVTANGRDSSDNPSYYLFNNCDVAAASGESVTDGEYYLGRPWKTYSRTVFQSSTLSAVINEAGWSAWNGDTDVDNVYYGEYANSGDGAEGDRVDWAQMLSSAVTEETVLGSSYTSEAWYDASYPS
ncbi:carbohydrate esterase family 8 protein [Xylariaceae sp. FL1019]|nr:carbohydrate esterase family 8 protein [Xylariaceae sp. FL1019]